VRSTRISILIASLVLLAAAAEAGPKEDMLAADRAFSALSVAHGAHAAFLATMTDDVQLFTGAHPPLLGKTAVAAYYAEAEKTDPTYKSQRLEWTPIAAEASVDGTLGTTRGTWVFSVPGADGAVRRLTGYYVTTWRRQSDGTYKFCLDIGGADKH
jgi:ketosteroid isomerase-like protein